MFSELKFPVPWGHVAAKAWGPSEGHPVLCLHGWLDNANTFDKLIPLLPRGCYYVAMDFSGHGLSSHRPAGCTYHFLDYVTDVRRVAAGGYHSVLIFSFSYCLISPQFCFLYPEMVDKLILLESLGFLLAPEVRSHVSFPFLKYKNRYFFFPSLVQRKVCGMGGRKTMFCSCCRSPKLVLPSGPISSLVFPSLSCPTCPVPSQECHTVSSVCLREHFPGPHLLCVLSLQHIQLAEVPGSHFVHLNEPEVVSGIISNFLTAQNTRARL
uniref:Serine hydrolase like 2 n=1 Tax=Catharus ustulatus TaxID=91951 RepID=A0A8C3TJL9_CATUS